MDLCEGNVLKGALGTRFFARHVGREGDEGEQLAVVVETGV